MHVTPADGSSKASDDGTLATLTFRWSHVADVLPSQIMWINISSISILHWHPVSVAHVQLVDVHDSESTGTVTVHYKAYGTWTKVRMLCSSDVSSIDIGTVTVHYKAYGTRSKVCVLCSSGVSSIAASSQCSSCPCLTTPKNSESSTLLQGMQRCGQR